MVSTGCEITAIKERGHTLCVSSHHPTLATRRNDVTVASESELVLSLAMHDPYRVNKAAYIKQLL